MPSPAASLAETAPQRSEGTHRRRGGRCGPTTPRSARRRARPSMSGTLGGLLTPRVPPGGTESRVPEDHPRIKHYALVFRWRRRVERKMLAGEVPADLGIRYAYRAGL